MKIKPIEHIHRPDQEQYVAVRTNDSHYLSYVMFSKRSTLLSKKFLCFKVHQLFISQPI